MNFRKIFENRVTMTEFLPTAWEIINYEKHILKFKAMFYKSWKSNFLNFIGQKSTSLKTSTII